jgi:receptor protein-tyrosine kinase
VLVLVLAAAGTWLALVPRRYTAVATVTAVPQTGVSISGLGDVENTLAALADSRPVVQDVVSKVGDRRSIVTLRREIVADRRPGTNLIRVRVTDRGPKFAATVANAVIDTLPLHDPTGGKLVFTDAGRAVPPASPSWPDPLPIWLIAAGIGIVLGIAVALVRDAAAVRVLRPGQLEELSGTEVLGEIDPPRDAKTVAVSEPSAITAQFRRVRVALEFAGSQTPTRTLVVAPVGADPNAGWFAVNLAATLAQVKHRVLLVDADSGELPRHPALALAGDGLAEVLAGSTAVSEAAVPSDIRGVSVLPLGARKLLAAEPLLELHFHRTFAELDDAYDIVLVSAPPLAASDDARVMAAGNSLLVSVAGGRTTLRAVRREFGEVRRMRLRLIGAVLLRRRATGKT